MDIEQAKKLIGKELAFYGETSVKVNRYIGKFYERRVKNEQILAKVKGNYGDYTVSVKFKNRLVQFNCSCYIGKHGCHHCVALAHTFLKEPDSFQVIGETKRSAVKNLEQLGKYLDYVSLSDLLDEMKSAGISQKEFAEAVGASSQYISSVKSSEGRNRFVKGLGAIKLACLWMIENADKIKDKKKNQRKKL